MSIQPQPPADRRGPGRPHKGKRHVTSVRIPHEIWDRLCDEAERIGVSRGDIVLHHVARAWQADDLDPIPDYERLLTEQSEEQQQLTMSA